MVPSPMWPRWSWLPVRRGREPRTSPSRPTTKCDAKFSTSASQKTMTYPVLCATAVAIATPLPDSDLAVRGTRSTAEPALAAAAAAASVEWSSMTMVSSTTDPPVVPFFTAASTSAEKALWCKRR